jgi:hypothetical protein
MLAFASFLEIRNAKYQTLVVKPEGKGCIKRPKQR